MARRKRPNKPAKIQSPKQIENEGRVFLKNGHYRQAVDSFKRLSRTDPETASPLLAQAYHGRAIELAEKGMFKEAAVTLDQMAAISDCGAHQNLRITFLINCGDYQKAVVLFQDWAVEKKSDDRIRQETILELFAGLALCGEQSVLNALPKDSPVLNHMNTAREAIIAYGQGNNEMALEALKRLPFRSAFRSLRLILQAMITVSSEETLRLLGKVPEHSTYYPLAEDLKTVYLPDRDLGNLFSGVSEQVQKWLIHSFGLDQTRLKLMQKIDAAVDQPHRLFRLLISPEANKFLPDAALKQFCADLLTSCPQETSRFEKRFGPLPAWHRHRVLALISEDRNHIGESIEQWELCAKNLSEDRNISKKEASLMAALAYRRMADLEKQNVAESDPWGWDDPWYEPTDDSQEGKYLEKSLQLDSEAREIHLRLATWHKERKDIKEQRRVVERALKQFPDDVAILEAAMDLAFTSKSFKKASKLAQRILEINPINAHVRRQLIASHIAHSRKQFCSYRFELAAKELNLAESLERSENRSFEVRICQATQALIKGENQESEGKRAEALQITGMEVLTDCMMVVEAAQLSAPDPLLKKLINRLSVTAKKASVTSEELLRITVQMESVANSFHSHIWSPLAPWLKKGVKISLSVEERRSVCHLLADKGRYVELERYAREGKIRWPKDPSFLFFCLFGAGRGKYWSVSGEELHHLAEMIFRPEQRPDRRTTAKILEFLPEVFHAGPMVPGIPIDPYEGEDDCEYDEVFEDIGDPYEMMVAVVMETVEQTSDLREKTSDQLYKKNLLAELVEGFPLGRQVLSELIDEALRRIPKTKPAPPKQNRKKTKQPPKQGVLDFGD